MNAPSSSPASPTPAYEGWAILELMGHRQRIGRVTEVEAFGGKLLRIDIPTEGGDVTEFYGCSSVYALRPVSEEIARDNAKRYGDIRPVKPVEYRLEDQRPVAGEVDRGFATSHDELEDID